MSDIDKPTTVKQITNHPNKRGQVGLELEVEAEKSLPVIDDAPWTSKSEPSLRKGGMEYVTERPLMCDERTLEALQMLHSKIGDYKPITNSPRTSVHVHVNVLNFTTTNVYTAACAYWLMEPSLMEYCGPNRVGNKFCLRLIDSEDLINEVSKDLKGAKSGLVFSRLDSNLCKYAGLNLSAVRNLGSMEFRGMRGIVDPEEIYLWTNGVYQLTTNAIQIFKSPRDVLTFHYRNGLDKLMESTLPGRLHTRLKKNHFKEEEADEMAALLAPISYKTDWQGVEHDISKARKALSEMPKIIHTTPHPPSPTPIGLQYEEP